jgi:hypothetical protein
VLNSPRSSERLAERTCRRKLTPAQADLALAIKELQAAGCESLRAIAAGLEERGIPAARGGASGPPFRWRDCWR